MAQRGVEKLLSKIKDNMREGNYYEGKRGKLPKNGKINKNYFSAHQQLRTIFFRLSNQQRHMELANILLDGAEQLLSHKQFQSGR
jgi:hypothetical protein